MLRQKDRESLIAVTLVDYRSDRRINIQTILCKLHFL